LFPTGWLPWDTHQHLSFIGTYIVQTQRSQAEGSFLASWQEWMQGDFLLIVCSIAATVFNLAVGWWRRKQLLLALLAASYWLLLIRGGVVFPFYFIPLIALTGLNTAFALNTLLGWAGKLVRLDGVRVVLMLGVIAALVPYELAHAGADFTQHPASAQTDAMTWIRQNVPHNDFIIINSYLYMDLHEVGGLSVGDGAPYTHAEVYINVDTDPALYQQVLQSNWDRIDYIVADSEVENYIKGIGHTNPGDLLYQAYTHSIMREKFQAMDQGVPFAIKVFEVQHKLPPATVTMAPHTRPIALDAYARRNFAPWVV
jgi:hypothetical protein